MKLQLRLSLAVPSLLLFLMAVSSLVSNWSRMSVSIPETPSERIDRSNTREMGEVSSELNKDAGQYYCDDDSEQRISIVTVSDRPDNGKSPLKGLVNSLLRHSTLPISLHVVTASPPRWLNELRDFASSSSGASSSSAFRIYYHSPALLVNQSKALIQETGFVSTHYSTNQALMKLFLTTLPFDDHSSSVASKVDQILVLDDDLVFYQDIRELHQLLRQHKDRLVLYCPIDPGRVKKYATNHNYTFNNHPERYCNSGTMGLPVPPRDNDSDMNATISDSTVDIFADAARSLMLQYPKFTSRVADQDIVNRAVANDHYVHHHVNTTNTTTNNLPSASTFSKMAYIPCEWFCDAISCSGPEPDKCSTCRHSNTTDGASCKGFHFLHKEFFNTKWQSKWPMMLRFGHYFSMDPLILLTSIYEPRVSRYRKQFC